MRELHAKAVATLPEESPQLAARLATLGQTLLTLKAWDEAEPILRQCLAIREKSQPNAWSTFHTKSMLGGALLGQRKFEQAQPLLLSSYQDLKAREATSPTQSSIRLIEAIERLVALYEATGSQDEAAAWRIRLDAAKAAQAEPPPK